MLSLQDLAQRVARRVNSQIRDGSHRFLFNNHRTFEKNTSHPEQRTSATYYALSHFGIPAYGVEASKEIRDYRVRVQYHTLVVSAFLEEVGVAVDGPSRS